MDARDGVCCLLLSLDLPGCAISKVASVLRSP